MLTISSKILSSHRLFDSYLQSRKQIFNVNNTMEVKKQLGVCYEEIISDSFSDPLQAEETGSWEHAIITAEEQTKISPEVSVIPATMKCIHADCEVVLGVMDSIANNVFSLYVLFSTKVYLRT